MSDDYSSEACCFLLRVTAADCKCCKFGYGRPADCEKYFVSTVSVRPFKKAECPLCKAYQIC